MFTCAFNWDLIYKYFQTSITIVIAIVIYFLWHKQKAREVFANESKEVIKDCLEFAFYLNDLELYELRSLEEYKELSKTIKKTSTQIERSLLFLDKNDSEKFLSGEHDNIWTRKKCMLRVLDEVIENYDKLTNDKGEYSNLKDSFYRESGRMHTSLNHVVDYLQPFSIYQLNFNRKKLAKSILRKK